MTETIAVTMATPIEGVGRPRAETLRRHAAAAPEQIGSRQVQAMSTALGPRASPA